jgi:glutamine amidotransferase
MIVIIDYGMGNTGSIVNMFKKIGIESKISSDINEIENASKLILPGVGSFDNGMRNISDRGLLDILNKKVLYDKTPVLGICLGCQLITRTSEEGSLPGLGWIGADTVRFNFDGVNSHLKIPHMGWNTVSINNNHPLVNNLMGEQRYYFVHSYHLKCYNEEDVLMKTHYGYDFPSAVNRENITGLQFHPEKSHHFGMQLLKNWAEQ